MGKWTEKDPNTHSIQEHHEEPSDTQWYCEDRPLGTLTDLTRYQGCVNRLGALADPDRPVFQIFGSDIIKNRWIFGSMTLAEAFEMECLIRSHVRQAFRKMEIFLKRHEEPRQKITSPMSTEATFLEEVNGACHSQALKLYREHPHQRSDDRFQSLIAPLYQNASESPMASVVGSDFEGEDEP